MGYAVSIAWIGVLAIAITTCYSLYNMHNSYVADVSDYWAYEKGIGDKQRAAISVAGANYSNETLEISVQNTGSSVLFFAYGNESKCTDVLIDEVWIEHINITADMYNKTLDPLLWDPTEYAKILVTTNLSVGTHTLTVVSCYGAKSDTSFDIF
jgi:archaellum component FlaG (FlaF/FlaG flagellin family)